MIITVFDMNKKTLCFSNAGHLPIIHHDGITGSCGQLASPGCALNMIGNFDYRVEEIPIQTNDVFLLYTDGITEAMNERSEMFEVDRLTQCLMETAMEKPGRIIEHVMTRLEEFTGRKTQEDDLLMIAVKVR